MFDVINTEQIDQCHTGVIFFRWCKSVYKGVGNDDHGCRGAGRVKRKKKGEYNLAYIDIKSEDLYSIFATKNVREPA